MTTYTISELAKEFDITPRAIRFYEDQGLIAPLREGSRRIYSARDRTRLKLTLRGKRLGFTLQEVKEMVDMYESPQDTLPQLEHFMAKLAGQRELLEQQREDLEITLSEIAAFEQQCRRLLGEYSAAGGKPRTPAAVTSGVKPGTGKTGGAKTAANPARRATRAR